MNLYAIQKKIRKLEAELEDLHELERRQTACKILSCEHCGRGTMIKNLIYIQTHWYVSPYGCTGGDCWREGEGQYVCPKCGHVNRSCSHNLNNKLKDFFEFKFLFEKLVKTHGSNSYTKRVANIQQTLGFPESAKDALTKIAM